MNSPKSDSNKSNPSNRKRKQRNSKKIDEKGPVTPITRFFEKKTQMKHENSFGESSTTNVKKRNFKGWKLRL